MFSRMTRRDAARLLAMLLTAACAVPGGPADPAAAVRSPAASGGEARPTETVAAAPTGAIVFRVLAPQSKATFRVREQLAGVELPSDAVGATEAVTGQLVLLPDGQIVSQASKIGVDLRELRTDDPRRDSFIKQNTLQTNQFPLAEFVPARAVGLPNPLPAAGEHAFRLTGTMAVHGAQKETTWDVRATRTGSQLAARATTTVKFGDFGMTPPRVPMVLTIVDEIRLELDLVAAQPS